MMRLSPCEEPLPMPGAELLETQYAPAASRQMIERGASHGAEADDDCLVVTGVHPHAAPAVKQFDDLVKLSTFLQEAQWIIESGGLASRRQR